MSGGGGVEGLLHMATPSTTRGATRPCDDKTTKPIFVYISIPLSSLLMRHKAGKELLLEFWQFASTLNLTSLTTIAPNSVRY